MENETAVVPRYPFGKEHRLELEPEIAAIRAEGKLVRVEMPVGGEVWLATRYDDIRTVLADPRFSRALANEPGRPSLSSESLPAGSISALDAPDHTRVKRVAAGAFTARRIRDLADRTGEVTAGLLDDLRAAGGPADFIATVSRPLPRIMICEMLGVPAGERAYFERLLSDLRSWQAPLDALADRRSAIERFIGELIEEKRREPGDDLLSVYAEAAAQGRLSDDELLNLGVALLAGGTGTPTDFLTGAVYVLLTRPDKYRALCEDRTLIPAAVEELLRYIPIGTAGGKVRVATEDVELGGVTVRAGEAVLPAMGSGNHDERVFENPGELDFGRGKNPHLGFGHGAHHCVGAQLARLEMRVTIEALVERFPDLRLAVRPEELDWLTGEVVRGLRALPVTWGATE
ncbi:cytochrome P450 [Streptomyces sp. NPDC031705]|uniref:cytochrome P450 n=1 Tax=Streptomyces sp. NPDC031705 TaxID=3155729 RepID=UPI0033EA08AC